MQVSLIALSTEETNVDIYNNVCPIIQRKLNLCAVEVINTTVFSDIYAIKQYLSSYLTKNVVIVGDFSNNIDFDMVRGILLQKYNATLQQFEAGYFISNGSIKCLIVDISKFNYYDYLTPQKICPIFDIETLVAHIKVFGLDKISILQKLSTIQNINAFNASVYVSYLDAEITITPKSKNVPLSIVQTFVRNLYEVFTEYYYGDNSATMLEVLDEILNVRNVTLSVADILTQGCFEKYLKEGLPNFEKHIVECHSLKTLEDVANVLGVGADFLATHNKGSVDLCYEMGATMVENIDASLSVVLSGTFKTPYLAVGDKQAIHVYKYNFDHSSDYITQIMCRQAVFKILKKLH